MFSTKGNKEQAFRAFYKKTHGKAFNFARKHTASHVLAEEILQTAYLKIWEKHNTIQPDFLAFKAYLYTTIRNLVIKEYQRKITEQEVIFTYQQLELQEEVEDHTEILLSEVKQAVSNLPEKQQQVFRLVKMEGLTYREVAEKLAISESTVEKHIIKALRTLRNKLSDFVYFLLL